MSKEITKEEIKQKAANLAEFLGYNIHSAHIDVINVQEAYCQGFSAAQSLLLPRIKELEERLDNTYWDAIERDEKRDI